MADATAPRVSVIIPHLNTPEALARCLTSVTGQALDHGHAEVIVVDNGSRVSLEAVKTAFPGVSWLAEPEPGPGPARNRGIAAARAPALAFIDADCRAAPGWLQTAVDAVEKDPQRAVVGGDIRIDFVDPARLTGIEAYEAVFGFRQKMYIETRHFSVTANLAMARCVHAAVGPFAGITLAEDLDWGQRARAAGYPVRYIPAMLVWHPARPTFAALEAKWKRHIRHDWNDYRGPRWRWQARAVAMALSIPAEAPKLLFSDRLQGLGNRFRGIGVLARIRLFRAAEMLRVMRVTSDDADYWNRGG
jgi:GT2 family glycosyltransferase